MYARAETDHHIRHIIVRLGKRHPRCCGDDVGIVTGYTQEKCSQQRALYQRSRHIGDSFVLLKNGVQLTKMVSSDCPNC